MTGNIQKTPVVESLPRFVESKVEDAQQIQGKSLPCSVTEVNGSIVTVKFEVQNSPFTLPSVPVPIIGCEYARPPTQVGDKGFVISADAYLGGMSGLGGGVANLVQQGNLATLVFVPIGNKNWAPSPDGAAYVIYGRNGHGVILFDDITGQATYLKLTSSGLAILGNTSIQGNLTVTGAITATGNITAGAGTAQEVDMFGHIHPITATTNTGPPVPGS